MTTIFLKIDLGLQLTILAFNIFLFSHGLEGAFMAFCIQPFVGLYHLISSGMHRKVTIRSAELHMLREKHFKFSWQYPMVMLPAGFLLAAFLIDAKALELLIKTLWIILGLLIPELIFITNTWLGFLEVRFMQLHEALTMK